LTVVTVRFQARLLLLVEVEVLVLPVLTGAQTGGPAVTVSLLRLQVLLLLAQAEAVEGLVTVLLGLVEPAVVEKEEIQVGLLGAQGTLTPEAVVEARRIRLPQVLAVQVW